MVSLYKHHAPSTTSLSDDGNDNDNDEETPQFAFYPEHNLAPAQWALKREQDESVALVHRSPSAHSPIANVPPEIMIQIFKHLHSSKDLFNVMHVSRTWCQCSVELLWHKPSFPKYDTIHKMAAILRQDASTFAYPTFVRRLNFLTHGAELIDELLAVFALCERLERLTLIGCKRITGEALANILPKFPHLVAIDLTGVTETTSDSIIGLAAVATRLQGINLSGCDKVTDSGIIALSESCPLLRRVKLSGLSLLTDDSVVALAKGCPMLLEIDLNHCALVTDHSIRFIWTHLTHMREMRLSHCPLLTDAGFPAPLRPDSQPDLVNPFSNSSVKMTDELPPLIINRTFDNLRMLDLTACALISDDAVEGIISHAPKIRNLVLSKCVLLTDRAVETICKLGRHLHYLHLGHASKITDRSVRLLARSCTRIRYIDFANCVNLTDMSVFELSALPKLRRIGLVRVSQLTDEAIYSLAERHATLERIHLSYCDQISVMAIHFLLLKLHKLTHLSLTGVPAFREEELQRFCREAPKDFNTAQRHAFCVFSGKGVSQLRTYLTELFDRITEMNNTDDTEYEEDEFDGEGYQEDDTPEPETVTEVVEMEGYPRQHMLYNPDGTTVMGHQAGHTQEPPQFLVAQPHEFPFQRDRPNRSATIPMTSVNRNELTDASISPTSNLRGATSRLNAQIQASAPASGSTRQGRVHHYRHNRTVADVLPVIESSSSHSLNENIPTDNGAGFFSNQIAPASLNSPRGSRALTPDLNYAEIGHGRGAQGSSLASRGQIHEVEGQQDGPSLPQTIPTPHLPVSHGYPDSEIDIDVDTALAPEHATPVAPVLETAWTHRDPSAMMTTTDDPRHSAEMTTAMSAPEQQRGRREYPGGNLSDPEPRARSVKRTFRNTLNAAEHYASSLFGRPVADNRPDVGGSGYNV